MASEILMGPVLSFRGEGGPADPDGWKVTAMLVMPAGVMPPAFELEGRAVPQGVCLARTPVGDVWRLDLSVQRTDQSRRVRYGLAGLTGPAAGAQAPAAAGADAPECWSFSVPARGQAPRLAYVSCNGFSDPKLIKGLKHPAHQVWQDLMLNHDRGWRPEAYQADREQQWHDQRLAGQDTQRFHVMLCGGDQVYMDGMWDAISELKAWAQWSDQDQLAYKPTADLRRKLEKFFWQTCVDRWSRVPPSKSQRDDTAWWNPGLAWATVPTVMMWDDHDIFDGWGSYTPERQRCPLLACIFEIARRVFWVLQMQMSEQDLPALEDLTPAARDPSWQLLPLAGTPAGQHPWATVKARDPMAPALLEGQPGFSHALRLGRLHLCVMDLRTERSQRQVLSGGSWAAWRGHWQTLKPGDASHVLVMSSVPVVHPKLSLVEGPLTFLASDNVTSGNADDLNDHWSHDRHEAERKQLVQTLLALADRIQSRVVLVSGDVHVAGWGLATKNALTSNGQRIHQLTSTGVVHPSPDGFAEKIFLWYVNQAGRQAQKLDADITVQMMSFPNTSQAVLARRNWLAIELDDLTGQGREGRLWATWRTEADQGFDNHQVVINPWSRQQLAPELAGGKARP